MAAFAVVLFVLLLATAFMVAAWVRILLYSEQVERKAHLARVEMFTTRAEAAATVARSCVETRVKMEAELNMVGSAHQSRIRKIKSEEKKTKSKFADRKHGLVGAKPVYTGAVPQPGTSKGKRGAKTKPVIAQAIQKASEQIALNFRRKESRVFLNDDKLFFGPGTCDREVPESLEPEWKRLVG